MTSASFSPDGRFALSGSRDHTLKLWVVIFGQCLHTFQGHTDSVTSASFSPDGRFVLSASLDNPLKLWEVATGQCLHTFQGHRSLVTSASFSPDGRFALSASAHGTLKLWEVATGQCLRTFQGHTGGVTSASFSTEGRFALSSSWDKTLKLWFLDWELEDKEPVDWDEGARPYLEVFLRAQVPYAAPLPKNRRPSKKEITLALTRQGRPIWTEADFLRLLRSLACAGYGQLRPEGIREQLEEMASTWKDRPLGGSGWFSRWFATLFRKA